MKITRTSPFTGKTNTMEIDATTAQLDRYAMGAEFVQDVFPDLTSDEREFIKSGITAEEWEKFL